MLARRARTKLRILQLRGADQQFNCLAIILKDTSTSGTASWPYFDFLIVLVVSLTRYFSVLVVIEFLRAVTLHSTGRSRETGFYLFQRYPMPVAISFFLVSSFRLSYFFQVPVCSYKSKIYLWYIFNRSPIPASSYQIQVRVKMCIYHTKMSPDWWLA